MDGWTRIVVGLVSFGFLVAYVAWKWRRAGAVMEARAAGEGELAAYFAAMLHDPRWHALRDRAAPRFGALGPVAAPGGFGVRHVALVDDRGGMFHPSTPGATRVVALVERAQPATQLYVSMDLATGALREDPAPYGWTYGPLR